MDHACETLRETDGPLSPVVATTVDGQSELHRFDDDTLEKSLDSARATS